MRPLGGSLKTISALFLLFFLMSCSHDNSQGTKLYAMAFDASEDETVKAAALKRNDSDGVCFEITLWIKGDKKKAALPNHWKAAWVDNKKRYHLFAINQRNPASLPLSQDDAWKNTFTGCVSNATYEKVSGVVLTPRETIAQDVHGLHMSWHR